MPVYLEDPSVLTKDKLKSELLAHNVELPSGNPTKDVYVQLYLKNLTAQNDSYVRDTTLGAFSSDEELPPPVVSSRSRSSGRKATKKTNKVRPEELDVTLLSDEGLKDEMIKHGVVAGPVVASIHKLYEKKLLDDSPAQLPQPKSVLTEIQVNHNNNSESDLYSDKEDEVTAPEPEPAAAEPEPAPVVDRPLTERSVTFCTRISQHQVVQKITACEQTPKVDENGVKELFSKDINIPTGITVTCRRPIKGAAGRPVKYGDLWNDKNSIISPEISKTTSSSSSYTQYRTVNSLPPSTSTSAFTSPTSTSSFSTLYSRRVSAAPPAGQTKAACRGMSLWIKVFLVVTVAAFLFLVYQAMESNIISPFSGAPDTSVQE